MNKGTMVLVGCVVGAGVLIYTTSGGDAARPTPTPEATARATELAHSRKTVKPATTTDPPSTPGATPTPTPVRLTLAQVRNLPRPFVPPVLTGGGGSGQPVAPSQVTPPAETPLPASSPAAPPPNEPPTEPPVTSTPAPPVVTPTPTPTPIPWWALPTPPPLPPYPDAGVAPKPPSE